MSGQKITGLGTPAAGTDAATKAYADLMLPLSTVTTKGDLLVASAASSIGRLGVGSDTFVLVADSAQPSGVKWAPVAPSTGGSSFVATDPIWDTKGDLAQATGADAAQKLPIGANGTYLVADSAQTTGAKWKTPAGLPELVFRYTVTGADKASIDTGVDTPDAGSNDWTNADLIEFFVYARTDEATVNSNVNVTLNNDTGAHYDYLGLRIQSTAAANFQGTAQTSFPLQVPGTTVADTAVFSISSLQFLNPNGTVGYKPFTGTWSYMDPGDATQPETVAMTGEFRSTSALTRLKIIPNTAGKKLKVGSQLLIYKRLAS